MSIIKSILRFTSKALFKLSFFIHPGPMYNIGDIVKFRGVNYRIIDIIVYNPKNIAYLICNFNKTFDEWEVVAEEDLELLSPNMQKLYKFFLTK